MITSHIQGANILKRAIEYMCSGPFDSDREDALNILNIAIEQCFESETIAYESGAYWVARRISTNAKIAPIGSVYYQIFKTGICASESTSFVTANLERAKTTCENLARVTSDAYRRAERGIARKEKAIRTKV
jgi:hypothetical protein